MPMKLNVGVTQTLAISDEGPRGASVSLEVELDSSLATDSGKLKESIRQHFTLARQTVMEEFAGPPSAELPVVKTPPPSPPLNGHKPDYGQRTRGLRLATPAQVKALLGIARRQRVNLRELIHERCSVERPEDLSLDQASEIIEALTSDNHLRERIRRW